jgi:hypothetical protein
MKTTVDIAENLLRQAKAVAAEERITLRELIEEGLHRVLEGRIQHDRGFRLRRATFRGEGLQPHVTPGSWQQLREAIYEGRGA